MTSLSKAGEKIIEDILSLKENEKLLIFTDKEKLNIAEAIHSATPNNAFSQIVLCDGNGTDIKKGYLTSRSFESSIPLELTDKLKSETEQSDAVIYAISGDSSVTGPVRHHWMNKYSDIDRKGRCIGMPLITEDMFKRLADINYKELYENGRKILQNLDGKEIKVETELGTNITFSLKHKNVGLWDEGKTEAKNSCGDISKKGTSGNIPAGEVFWEPVDYSSFNGTIVVDSEFGKREKGPLPHGVKYEVEEGIVDSDSVISVDLKTGKEIGLKKEAKWFKNFVEEHDDARVMYEFGVGTNPNAVIKKDSSLLEFEKVISTVHFAQGSKNHNDGLVLAPTISVKQKDGSYKPIIKGEVVTKGSVKKGKHWKFL